MPSTSRRDLSLQVLHLLAQLLDRRLHGQADARQLEIGGFGAERVGFPVQLLAQEIEPPADGAAFLQQPPSRLHMRMQAVQLLGGVGALNQQRRFLREPVLRQRRRGSRPNSMSIVRKRSK